MELENTLLKDDVTNKQRFIDIILHNTVRNLLETLMLVVLSMLQTRQVTELNNRQRYRVE